jgi:nucleotide-binding universal stress UspA family protein
MWTTLSGIIHKREIDLVVIGTHGRQGFRKVVMGSVAEKVYRQATCPVLTIGPEAATAGKTQWQPRRIIFPTDFSETSLHALPYALSFAEENEGTLILLHMIPLTPWQYQKALEQSIRERLNQLVPVEVRCKLEFAVGFDFPADAVLRAAGGGQADLIVMGVNKRSAAVSAHLPWSTASHVVGQAPCPVLTVRG